MSRVRALVFRVAIDGPSMLPTLSAGEWWLARRSARITAGDLVVFDHPSIPDLIAVKRAIRREGGGWWVEGDNQHLSTDSRHFGTVSDDRVRGTLWVRYRPAPWRSRKGRD